MPHNEAPPSTFRSYELVGNVFSFIWQGCKNEGSIPLFQCRKGKYTDSILSTSPEIECTESTGYSRKEPIGRCFAEQNDARGLVALEKYYSDALDAHLYTTDKDDVDLNECKYEGIMCYVYPPEQIEYSVASALMSSFVKATTESPSPAPTAAASASPRSERKGLLKDTEQEGLLQMMHATFSDQQSPIDIIIMLDSSTPVAVGDEDFSNWQAEIDYAASLIDSEFVPAGSRVALINYSGCGPSRSLEYCQERNKLKLEWGLNEYSTKEEVLARLDSMGPDDFNYGYTWTDEALAIALAE